MTAVLLVIMYARYEVMTQSISGLISTRFNYNDPARKVIITPLNGYGLLDCDQVVDYYRTAVSLSMQAQFGGLYELISVIMDHPENTSRLLSVLCEHLERRPFMLPKVVTQYYQTNKMVDASPLRLRLLDIVKKKYVGQHKKKFADYSSRELETWFRMCHCRAMLHDSEIVSLCLDGLNDKRIIYDISDNANPSASAPLPTRVCDYCIMALLYYSQANIYAVFDRHGLNLLKNPDYARMNINMFDDVIKNRDKYLKLK